MRSVQVLPFLMFLLLLKESAEMGGFTYSKKDIYNATWAGSLLKTLNNVGYV